MYGKHCSDDTKRRMSLASKGKKKSKEHSENISKGKKGMVLTEEHKIKIGLGGIGLHAGDKNGNWKGGISKIDKLCRLMAEYKKWRSDIFARDSWTCRTCGISKNYVTSHHIKGFSKIIRENKITDISEARKCGELWDTDNGITLCEECHKLTDNYAGRGSNKINLK